MIHGAIGLQKNFERRKSLQFAPVKKDADALQQECDARMQAGIEVRLYNQDEVRDQFGFEACAALYSSQAAQHDAYLFTQKLIKWCADHGAAVFDKTEINDIITHSRSVELVTSRNLNLKARHAVMATGYEAVRWIDKTIAQLHSTYAIISEPFPQQYLWRDECLIWETSHPYLYLRTTPDHRVIIGGKDEMFSSAGKRDALIHRKQQQLEKAFRKLFPHLAFATEFAWAGTFAETRDGLPYIGIYKKMPNVFFALGFGGNGITFSQVTANIIRDMIMGKKNPDQHIFTFDRLNNT
ncbi:MAG TPA: FAD-dependent oxidoreductase [Chitinophagales bacterium]|nr:FAD-dependent oxidoreductase [Chitinophagales bacterium]